MNLVENQSDHDLLAFILDMTIERWNSELGQGIDFVSQDPTMKSFEEMLDVSGSLTDMITQAQEIRTRLERIGVGGD